MKIDTCSLHYYLYDLTYSAWRKDTPSHSNLCQYMRRLALSPIILLIPALFVALVGILLAVRAILTYPLGYSTNWKSLELRERSTGMFQIRGFQFYAGYFILPFAIAALNFLAWKHFPHTQYITDRSQLWAVGLIVCEGVLLFLGLLFSIFLFFSSDTFDLIQEWVDAKTQGVCPLIEFDKEDEE